MSASNILGLRPADTLTPREREIIPLAAEGMRNEEIGARLGISQRTVKNHMYSVFNKLGLGNRVEVTRWWLLSGQHDARTGDERVA